MCKRMTFRIGVMQHEREKIEINDAMETLGQIVKKSGKVAMLRDRFRHFEQGFELTPRMFERRCGVGSGGEIAGSAIESRIAPALGRGSTNGL